jgi:hypothetical protein
MYLNRKYLENELSKYNASQIIEKKKLSIISADWRIIFPIFVNFVNE